MNKTKYRSAQSIEEKHGIYEHAIHQLREDGVIEDWFVTPGGYYRYNVEEVINNKEYIPEKDVFYRQASYMKSYYDVSRRTLVRWTEEGILKNTKRDDSGNRLYDENEFRSVVGLDPIEPEEPEEESSIEDERPF